MINGGDVGTVASSFIGVSLPNAEIQKTVADAVIVVGKRASDGSE
jgi:hypothetical protein